MGNQRIGAVIAMLQEAGIRADRGYPQQGIPYPDTPLVAVTLQEQTEQKLVLALTVYATTGMGGAICEALAMDIGVRLEQLGAAYSVGACSYDSKAGLLTQTVLARWEETAEEQVSFAVQIGNQRLSYITAVTARHAVDYSQTEDGLVEHDKGWFVTLAEKLPADTLLEAEATGSFTVHVLNGGGTQSYPGCRWSEVYYEPVADGVIRRRVAHSWEDRIVTAG